MTDERRKVFESLERKIGNTPLVEVKNIKIPNNNRIFIKEEYKNPTASHYDRYWIRYMKVLEERGELSLDMNRPLLETSTGNSGASFAWICQELGYKCEVVIPKDIPSARIQQITKYGATIIFSPEKLYVSGLIREFKRQLVKNRDKYIILNHANDEKDGVFAMYDLGVEITKDLKKYSDAKIDYFISALGNGLTTRWISTALKDLHQTSIIGVEPYESPTIFPELFPERYDNDYHTKSNQTHGLIGSSPGKTGFEFPNMRKSLNLLDDIYLVKEDEWKSRLKELHNEENQFIGNTSAACFDAAMRLANATNNKIILVIFYDPAWKYTD